MCGSLAQGFLGIFLNFMSSDDHISIIVYSKHLSACIYDLICYANDANGEKPQKMVNVLNGQRA